MNKTKTKIKPTPIKVKIRKQDAEITSEAIMTMITAVINKRFSAVDEKLRAIETLLKTTKESDVVVKTERLAKQETVCKQCARTKTRIEEAYDAIEYWVRLANLFNTYALYKRRKLGFEQIMSEMCRDYGFVKEQCIKDYAYKHRLSEGTKVPYMVAIRDDKTWDSIFSAKVADRINSAFEAAGNGASPVRLYIESKGYKAFERIAMKLRSVRGWNIIIARKHLNNGLQQDIPDAIESSPKLLKEFRRLVEAEND